jgi:ribose-phosphate pyrophosphokinase
MDKKLAIFCGNSNKPLAEKICAYLGINLGDVLVERFSEGEIKVKINENVRGKDVFIVQSTCPPPNENLMELLILIDALRRASAQRITAVIPYFGYARQDRKDQPRVPITAKLIANLITTAGADRVLTLDLHAGQIQGFFDIPVDNLFAVNMFVDYFRKKGLQDLIVISPDVGGIKMARAYAKRLNSDLAIVDKRRINDRDTEVMHIIGEIDNRVAVIIDDIVATAGTLIEAANALSQHGAKEIYAAATHPVLSGPALERLEKSNLREVIVTDTIPIEEGKKIDKIKVLSVDKLFGEAIKRIHLGESVSILFQ